ncbi:hypothetical protein AA309_28010 [Microvirga vignae]|uniref:Uncharacterized protein n=1 Tax=Microvirga vignae TaxID=1225564 RepID=A0A0H1R4K9_9HYPH|nr:hypothetical protein AA309_28010 [Microvirga vignae]
MPNLLALGPRRPPMIVPRLVNGTGFMRWPHVREMIRTSELQSPDMFDNPPLAHGINLALAQHAHATGPLPHLEALPWGQLASGRGSYICDVKKRHVLPPSYHGYPRRLAAGRSVEVRNEPIKNLQQALTSCP